jgi:hypothetical protein
MPDHSFATRFLRRIAPTCRWRVPFVFAALWETVQRKPPRDEALRYAPRRDAAAASRERITLANAKRRAEARLRDAGVSKAEATRLAGALCAPPNPHRRSM